MKNLNKKTKKVLSFVLVLLMVVSTIFVGGVQETKADTGSIYEPYYDAENGKVVGVPEVGTVLTAGDIIKAGDNLADSTSINIYVCALEEEVEETAYTNGAWLSKGDEVDIADLHSKLCENKNGLVMKAVEYEDYETSDYINITLLAVDQPIKLEDITLEFDWSKFEAEIGGTLSPLNFKDGFIKNDGITSNVEFYHGKITVTSPDGTSSAVWLEDGEECIINETNSYSFEAVFSLEDGYYFANNSEQEIVVNDDTVSYAYAYDRHSPIWAVEVYVGFELGTGAEIIERIESASTPTVPPAEDEVESSELMEVLTDAVFEFYEYFVGMKLNDESTNVLDKGAEIHPFTTGTAEYIDEARSWWASCAWISSSDGVVIEIVDINDTTKADEIEDKFGEWEYYQQFPNTTYQYHNGEYIVFAVIPEKYVEAGITFDVLKAYLDEYYNKATNQVVEDENDYSANIQNKTEVAEKIELTEAEQKAIENGAELEVILTFKENGTTANTEEQKAIEKELADKKIGTYLEIGLSKKVGAFETVVSETTGAVAITFELPKELINENVKRTYSVMRYHDGKVDVLDAKYDAEKGTITFETDKFSTYAVVYEDVVIKAPATGDTTNVAMYVMLLVCGAGIILASRKMNRV